jgi:hypothetical protein
MWNYSVAGGTATLQQTFAAVSAYFKPEEGGPALKIQVTEG